MGAAKKDTSRPSVFLLSIPLMLVGIFMILGSFMFRSLPNDVVWTNEQAEAHQQAADKYHRDQFDTSISKIDLKTSREEFEAIDADLNRAKNTQQTLPTILRWAGIAAAGVGYVLLTVKRTSED